DGLREVLAFDVRGGGDLLGRVGRGVDDRHPADAVLIEELLQLPDGHGALLSGRTGRAPAGPSSGARGDSVWCGALMPSPPKKGGGEENSMPARPGPGRPPGACRDAASPHR